MKNQSLATVPLITATQVHDGTTRPTTRRSFRLCCFLLGFFVGVFSQQNDLATCLMVYFHHNSTNIFLSNMLYAAAVALQLMVFLCLLRRATHGVPNDGNMDLEFHYGIGGIVGVSMALLTFLPGVFGACLLVIHIAASVLLYVVLLRIIGVLDTVEEEETSFGFYTDKKEEAMKESEYQLMIV